jgi:hypothetical protein
VLFDSHSVETWRRAASGVTLRFHYVALGGVSGCPPLLLEACAKTPETLRFYADDALAGELLGMGLPMDSS